jgi:hypothetical protein
VNIYQLRNVDGHWKILPTHPQGVAWGCSVMSDSASIKSK